MNIFLPIFKSAIYLLQSIIWIRGNDNPFTSIDQLEATLPN